MRVSATVAQDEPCLMHHISVAIKQATVLYNKASKSFYITGDYAAFKAKFGYENTQRIVRIGRSYYPMQDN